MSETLDIISRKLASGMSRRKAFWQLLTGTGAVAGLALLTPQKAHANAAGCAAWCFQQSNAAFTFCMEAIFDPSQYPSNIPFIQIIQTCLSFEGQVLNDCTAASIGTCASGKCLQYNYKLVGDDFVFSPNTCVTPNI